MTANHTGCHHQAGGVIGPVQVCMLDAWTVDSSQKLGKGGGGGCLGPGRKRYLVTEDHAGCHRQAGGVARPAQGCRHTGAHTYPACRCSGPRLGPCTATPNNTPAQQNKSRQCWRVKEWAFGGGGGRRDSEAGYEAGKEEWGRRWPKVASNTTAENRHSFGSIDSTHRKSFSGCRLQPYSIKPTVVDL